MWRGSKDGILTCARDGSQFRSIKEILSANSLSVGISVGEGDMTERLSDGEESTIETTLLDKATRALSGALCIIVRLIN